MAKNKVTTAQVNKPAPSKLLMGLAAQASTRLEGSPMERTEVEHLPDGSIRFSLNLNDAPVPQRRYVADIATVEYNGLEVNFVFAQTKIFGHGIESALSIKINLNAFSDITRALHINAGAELEKALRMISLKKEELVPVTSEPAHSAKLIANVANYAVSGHETCIDFYHVNAYANAKLMTSDKVDVEAVVRVDLRTSLFVALSAAIGKIAERIAAGE
ncbi:hypothetical protein [Massilia orientalis]|uniref:Uncharacterized protein n=1 Tax=Massilia orientalis TaxID=3050128 RepID=A0ACC7MJJ7_9BURK|nr:hypothetical protein [Massilia sp. YIM B02787]